MRFEDDTIQRMKKQYETMISNPCTTLWEHWHGGNARNHDWSGGVMTLMFQYVLGVAPDIVGYDEYRVLPQMGPLKHITANVSSVKSELIFLKKAPIV